MRTQAEKGRMFRELHERPGLLLLPNPWDAGTARLLQSLGFEALATTSLGMSNALGRVDGDGAVSRAELLENCRAIASATDLPVNADLENGYADDPKEAAFGDALHAFANLASVAESSVRLLERVSEDPKVSQIAAAMQQAADAARDRIVRLTAQRDPL